MPTLLVACEESQRVCTAFRERGWEAYSCDLQECSGGHPEWHIKGDVLSVLGWHNLFLTEDGKENYIDHWDLIIAHPPCDYLTNVATRHHSIACTADYKIKARTMKRIEAARFFMNFTYAPAAHIAIENPVGVMNTFYRRPDCIIEPWHFASGPDDKENFVTKKTCFWLKGLPPLERTYQFEKPNNADLYGVMPSGKARTWEDTFSRDPKVRSKTFPGIAKAMADQWGDYVEKEMNLWRK